MTWTKYQVLRLLDLYENNSILYDVQHICYYNKVARRICLENIAEQLEPIKPDITVDAIKSKINTLRTQFNKELKKRNLSVERVEITRQTSLWCFEKMLFLQNTIHKNLNQLNNDSTNNSNEILITKVENVNEEPEEHKYIQINEYEFSESNILVPEMQSKKRIRSSECSQDEDPLSFTDPISLINERTNPHTTDNEWDLFSKFVALEIHTLKLEKNRKKLKKEILKCILQHQELEEEELN